MTVTMSNKRKGGGVHKNKKDTRRVSFKAPAYLSKIMHFDKKEPPIAISASKFYQKTRY
jgi:hypothetical protein